MKITKILAPEATPAKTILDRAAHIALTSEQRAHLPNEVTVNGQTIEVSIENARALEVGDALLDETGHFYVIEAAPEPVLVIKAEEEMAAEAAVALINRGIRVAKVDDGFAVLKDIALVKMLSSSEDCTNNDLFKNAANTMHRLDPSYNSAHFLYQLYSSEGDIDNAFKYIDEAIAYPESDNATDAQYSYEAAAFAFKSSRNADAFKYAMKAAELDETIAGKAYMLIGTIWGSLVCQGNEIERRAPYWVAVDYMVKAKNADPSLAEEANKHIAQYRQYYPQAAEAFMYNVTDGDSYTVSCGGMRAVTTVKTQQ